MTRIGQSDHVLLLIRERLSRLERGRAGRSGKTAGAKPASERPLARLQSLAAAGQLLEEDVERTLVRALLTEELGEGVANDPSFQAVSDDVYRIISGSEEGRALIAAAAAQVKA